MGIIDTLFAETKPARHHIIEVHPGVLEHISSPGSKFGSSWEESGPEPGAFKVYRGKWQEVCQQLLREGQIYDAIYFDTFGEDYSQLRMFFTEFIPGLLDSRGVFGFFNGLGADRLICYDVYTKVAELHLVDAGLDVEWQVVTVDMSQLAEAGKGEWEGVKRRYWTLDKYRLPVCTFLGRAPIAPQANPRIPGLLKGDAERLLQFEQEERLAGTLAFLSGVSDDPSHVIALCIEELTGGKGVRIVVAINKKGPDAGNDVLERIKKGLENIFSHLSRINNEEYASLEGQVFRAIVDMCENRILGRIASQRPDATYTKKWKTFFGATVQQAIDAARDHGNKGIFKKDIESFTSAASLLLQQLARLEVCKTKDVIRHIKAVIRAAYRLNKTSDFDKIFSGIGARQLDPNTRTAFIRRLGKLARYLECALYLLELAKKKCRLFKRTAITTVSLDPKLFSRSVEMPADCRLTTCLARCQRDSSIVYDARDICRRLNTNPGKKGSDFMSTVKKVLGESRVHAEPVSILFAAHIRTKIPTYTTETGLITVLPEFLASLTFRRPLGTETDTRVQLHWLPADRAAAFYVARPRGFIPLETMDKGVEVEVGNGDGVYLAYGGEVVAVEAFRGVAASR
ncbi:Protein arginine N-methyltransferase 2 [Madurella mycetomatis]|uniref:Protein arginine N-methyltransferase 2 n=1 Tax=Madurella mycetomatis TaxID=100816 RepID=A0A175W4P0_9PEZI|nr:Protein arginine N-methyltransferase 2 [Madurella mycetomatis]